MDHGLHNAEAETGTGSPTWPHGHAITSRPNCVAYLINFTTVIIDNIQFVNDASYVKSTHRVPDFSVVS